MEEIPSTPEYTQTASVYPLPAGPAARRLARELGVDLKEVRGTGPNGRITPEDVDAAASATETHTPATSTTEQSVESGEDHWGPIRRERLSDVQRAAINTVTSAASAPQATQFDDADVTNLERLCKDAEFTLTPVVLKAVGEALRNHRVLNAVLDKENDQIVYKQYMNLGVVINTRQGSLVPVVRNVDRLTIPQIAQELNTLAERARSGQLTAEDLCGGTFTVGDLGPAGGAYATLPVNPRESAVLVVGRQRWTPAVCDGKIDRRLTMPLSLSYDRRLIDEGTAGRFLCEVIDYLQSPGKLLLQS